MPIRPEPLVQRAELEIGLVVQHQAGEAFLVLAQGDLAHAEIALDLVHAAVAQLEADHQVVEVRVLRRPEPGVLDRHRNLPPGAHRSGVNHLPPVANRHLDHADRPASAVVLGRIVTALLSTSGVIFRSVM